MQDMQKIPDVLHSFLLVDNGKMQLALWWHIFGRGPMDSGQQVLICVSIHVVFVLLPHARALSGNGTFLITRADRTDFQQTWYAFCMGQAAHHHLLV